MIENSNDPTAEIKYRLTTSLLAPQKLVLPYLVC